MPAGIHKFILEQGETFDEAITWKDSAGTPINLTGYSARMQVRKDVTASSQVIECTTVNGRIVLGGALGTITFNIASADTASIQRGMYVYDLELISGSGSVKKLLKGQFEVLGEVTR